MLIRLGRERCRAAVIAVTVLAGVGFVVPVTGNAAGGQCPGIETTPGGWTAAPLPATPSVPMEGSTPIVATTVVGQDASVALATDGVAVFRTTDGGCNWKTVFTLGAADYYSDSTLLTGYAVTNIANGHDARPANQQDVYLALSPNALNAFALVTLFGAAPPELIAASHDGGQTFTIVAPQPSAANPIVPECLTAPIQFLVPPTDPKTVYLLCSGGLAQTLVDEELTGGSSYTMYRSTDGGVSWALLGLPTFASYGTNTHWLAPGVHKNELWLSGYSTSSSHNYLTAWRSSDAGKTWTTLLPDPKNPISSSSGSLTAAALAVDTTPGPGLGQVAIYSSAGAYVTTDSGKHWQRLRAVTFTNGTRPPAAGFFLQHSLYLLYAGEISCKGLPVLVRYPKPTSRPVTLPFPSKWGTYGGWASDSSFAVVGRGLIASGFARFCGSGGSTVTTTKLLNLRAR